jgi:DNA-directed RNA polymerase sigma subunit (sigma70/sigma32)
MPAPDASKPIPEDCRRDIFRALVETQDTQVPAPDSRREVALRFGITTERVRQIQREGLDKKWPPL